MTRVAENTTTLKSLREAMNDGEGLTLQAVADRLADLLGESSRTSESISNIEKRGTRDWYVIRGLSVIYGRTPDEIAEIALRK